MGDDDASEDKRREEFSMISSLIHSTAYLATRDNPLFRWKYTASISEWTETSIRIRLGATAVDIDEDGEETYDRCFPPPDVKIATNEIKDVAYGIRALLNATSKARGDKREWSVSYNPTWLCLYEDGSLCEIDNILDVNTIQFEIHTV